MTNQTTAELFDQKEVVVTIQNLLMTMEQDSTKAEENEGIDNLPLAAHIFVRYMQKAYDHMTEDERAEMMQFIDKCDALTLDLRNDKQREIDANR